MCRECRTNILSKEESLPGKFTFSKPHKCIIENRRDVSVPVKMEGIPQNSTH